MSIPAIIIKIAVTVNCAIAILSLVFECKKMQLVMAFVVLFGWVLMYLPVMYSAHTVYGIRMILFYIFVGAALLLIYDDKSICYGSCCSGESNCVSVEKKDS